MHVHCTDDKGMEMGKGTFRFQHNRLHHIRQEVHLNDQPGQNGYIRLWVDGHSEIHVTDVIMRKTQISKLTGCFSLRFSAELTAVGRVETTRTRATGTSKSQRILSNPLNVN
ncbi:hypothetical protein DPMN_174333 [Dreissena polymorpha]|uniref:Polysaccharide lyase 14 domain-containing protein n=1 Tax=Dreissena polymorpha TaxID=45954 RepID=A0A9D4IGB0_DREPO|nr:hypothetical protein DPMN_174333 [Dreissena polymorpha]